jgi:hypothetical protein
MALFQCFTGACRIHKETGDYPDLRSDFGFACTLLCTRGHKFEGVQLQLEASAIYTQGAPEASLRMHASPQQPHHRKHERVADYQKPKAREVRAVLNKLKEMPA